ncbi:ATP-binding protein [Dapis sp. BLCC M229]|uniref:ATP-binding protein n=1 Tax=Dapis sp. BLCC M229 TaxID=3400188 RepID=UPI003CF297CB
MSEPRKPLHPVISYNHILSELSVNREDPCEVIRELISNSYDAKASQIQIYPLLQEKGFIFFDDGTGLSETKETNGITPYRAFFSIGRTTKVPGDSIGYKCQGSKLCFASKKITIITRCSGETSWRYISIDNPQKNINEEFDISSHFDEQPWDVLTELFPRPQTKTKNILNQLNQYFFTNHFNHQGTMIIIEGLDVQDFSDFYSSDDYGRKQWSYLKHYIRFNTRHGDMRILRPDDTGFPKRREVSFRETIGYNDRCKLFLWSKTKKDKYTLENIKPGYPYLPQPDATEAKKIKSPAQVSSLDHGNFSARYCSTFSYEETIYCIVLAIDGKTRTRNQYQELGRQGDSRSGIKLSSQRGTFISSEGVKICSYNKIFEHESLKEYSIFADTKVQYNYILIINGSFDMVTNRNSLTDDSRRILKNDSFLKHIKKFLDEAKRQVPVFRELIERLNKENQEAKLEAYTERLDKLKKDIKNRTRFKVNNIEQLKDKWIVRPERGEEHWVGALYTMFSHLVTVDLPYAELWVRPRTFCGVGLDSIAVPLEENSLKDTVHQGLEYKYTFSPSPTDEYNHPFIETNFIVCWDMDIPEEGEQIKDAYDYFGYVSLTEKLNDIGYEIVDIQRQTGEDPHPRNIKVISLKKLLDKTFDCTWITPPK